MESIHAVLAENYGVVTIQSYAWSVLDGFIRDVVASQESWKVMLISIAMLHHSTPDVWWGNVTSFHTYVWWGNVTSFHTWCLVRQCYIIPHLVRQCYIIHTWCLVRQCYIIPHLMSGEAMLHHPHPMSGGQCNIIHTWWGNVTSSTPGDWTAIDFTTND